MAYTQQVAMCLSDKVTLCMSFNTGPVLTALHSTGLSDQVILCTSFYTGPALTTYTLNSW